MNQVKWRSELAECVNSQCWPTAYSRHWLSWVSSSGGVFLAKVCSRVMPGSRGRALSTDGFPCSCSPEALIAHNCASVLWSGWRRNPALLSVSHSRAPWLRSALALFLQHVVTGLHRLSGARRSWPLCLLPGVPFRIRLLGDLLALHRATVSAVPA